MRLKVLFFIVAFGIKYVKANAVFIAKAVSEGIIVWLYFLSRAGKLEITHLWFNPIGVLFVVVIALFLQAVWPKTREQVTFSDLFSG